MPGFTAVFVTGETLTEDGLAAAGVAKPFALVAERQAELASFSVPVGGDRFTVELNPPRLSGPGIDLSFPPLPNTRLIYYKRMEASVTTSGGACQVRLAEVGVGFQATLAHGSNAKAFMRILPDRREVEVVRKNV